MLKKADVYYIIRDFNKEKFRERKATVKTFIREMKNKYGEDRVTYEMTDQYYNMRDQREPVKESVEIAEQAIQNMKIKPIIEPIRGATDGSQLAYMGLPTPTTFTAGENFPGKFE